MLADLVDLDDVRVADLGNGAGLVAEAGELRGSGMLPRQDSLEGDDAVEVELVSEVDDPHSPTSKLSQHFVTGQIGGTLGGRGQGSRQTTLALSGRFRVGFRVDPQERGHRCDRPEPLREVRRDLRAIAADVVHCGGLTLLP